MKSDNGIAMFVDGGTGKPVSVSCNLDGTYTSPAVDEFGKPVERTKEEYPYAYDGFVIWRCGANSEAVSTVYSDRLYQLDYEKHDKFCQKHFGNKGQYWNTREPKKIQAFLLDYLDKPKLKLIFVMEYCNMSSGYPVWRFDYKY